MKIFIQSFDNGIPRNSNIYCAYLGGKLQVEIEQKYNQEILSIE